MNESELETQLRTLRPAAPSAALERAIAADLRAGREFRGIPERTSLRELFSRLAWAGAGAALATGVVLAMLDTRDAKEALHAPTTPARDDASRFRPGEFTRETISTEEGGLFLAMDEPARVVRYQSIERHVWDNSHTGARVEVQVPREDLVLLPVAYQ